MSLYAYLWGIRLFLLLSLCAWIGIVFAVDPYQTGRVGVSLFFVSLFGTLLGILVLSLTGMYQRVLGVTGATRHLGVAFRQAFLLSFFLIFVVFLQMERLLTWWGALLLLTLVLLGEFTARRLKKSGA